MNRRRLLKASAGFAVLGLALPRLADTAMAQALRAYASAEEFGIRPDAAANQGDAFSAMLERASAQDIPLFLPPGRYIVSNITLPPRVRLAGVPGATRLVIGGESLLIGRNLEHLALEGLVFEGAHRPLPRARALLDLEDVAELALDRCTLRDSGASGARLVRTAGRIERTAVAHAADAGIFSTDARGLDIARNTVTDCGNGGILVYRSTPGEDATRVADNRIARIRADGGGTGQHGNGITVYRADQVAIAGNHVSDCAFSAIRSNAGGNVRISGNHCLRSGETAIYSEFAFVGAVIDDNLVDGAANGISIVNSDKGGRLATCTGNIVRNLSTDGPYETQPPGFGTGITVEADSTVSANVIENAPTFGIRIGWGPFLRNVVAADNVIRKTGTGIVVSVVEGSGTAVISGNIIEAAANGAIVGHRWAEPVTGDLAHEGASGFAHLTLTGNRAI